MRTILLLDSIHVPYNDVIGLFPRNSDKSRFRGSFWLCPFHGIFKTFRMIKTLEGGISFGAYRCSRKSRPGFYMFHSLAPLIKINPAKRAFVAPVTEGISPCLFIHF
jgi:hypothetical protein